MKPFQTLEHKIDFWLFHMPASFKYKPENMDRVKSFFNSKNNQRQITAESKVIVEFRESSWWNASALEEMQREEISFCSIGVPGMPNRIISLNDVIYLRLYGTQTWYNYLHPEEKLREIVCAMTSAQAKKAIYLNNDYGVLQNGLFLLRNLS